MLVQMVKTVKESLKAYESLRCDITPPPPCRPSPLHPCPLLSPPRRDCTKERAKLAETLATNLKSLEQRYAGSPFLRDGSEVNEAIDIFTTLSENMKKPPESNRSPPRHRRHGFDASRQPSSVTAGGAQDFGHFKLIVKNGGVPQSEAFVAEGFLNEFSLGLQHPSPCHELLCLEPAIAFQRGEAKDHLYVQLSMGSALDTAAVQRRPLNLSVVLDVSGSMSAEDNTERSRIDWAKDALRRTIAELNENDILSIVLFETTSKVLLESQFVADKESILALVDGIAAGGSTNLEAGLRDGYEEVAKRLSDDRENRVILISDAGLNTGVTDESAILQMVSDFASHEIGLTAMGLGLNFNQEFIHTISRSRGGNYIFANSGQEILEYTRNFDLLVTPIAFKFLAQMDIRETPPLRLVETYGIPRRDDEPVRDLINIQTLFLAGKGGGAPILVYEVAR
jgi:Ca-activated chloride channel family protein